jgi:hypothetical protein
MTIQMGCDGLPAPSEIDVEGWIARGIITREQAIAEGYLAPDATDVPTAP